jgi:alpha-tubulin suppressor-like RCC1 family protein
MIRSMNRAPATSRLALPVVGALIVSVGGVVSAPAALAAPTSRPAPSPVAAGYNHTVALASNGTVWAWGSGDNGDLGIGTHAEHDTAVQVKGVGGSGVLSHVAAVSAGTRYSLALLANGNVVGWGDNTNGQLGDNTNNNERANPVYVKGPSGSGHLTGIVAIAANPLGTTSLALKSDGTVWAWGSNNAGQLGNANGDIDTKLPVVVHSQSSHGKLTHVVAIAAGAEHSVAVRSDGTVWSWGGNGNDQLGDGLAGGETDRPAQVVGVGNVGKLTHVVGVAAGGYFTVALKSDGTMLGWGDDQYGQLGDFNAPTDSDTPVAPFGLGGRLVAIAAATFNSYAVKADGTVWGWGNNVVGSVGIGNTSPYVQGPLRVNRLVDGFGVVALGGGYQTGAAVTSHGALYRWGWNSAGQLGESTEIESDSPVRAGVLPKIANPALRVLVAPKISGTAKVGHTLSVSKGTWGLPATEWRYKWLRSGHAISHATKATYKLTSADAGRQVSVAVTAARHGYPSGHTTTAAKSVS